MTRVLLVRHGETDWNSSGRVQGWMDRPLNDLGRRQASALARRLADLPITAILSSDLERAFETATILSEPHGLRVSADTRLRERCYGAWEGLNAAELAARYPAEWEQYHHRRSLDVEVPEGETWAQVIARMTESLNQALADYGGDDQTLLIVGHGGSLRAIILDALLAPLPTLLRLRIDNAALSCLQYIKAGDGRVLLLNDTSHLEGLL